MKSSRATEISVHEREPYEGDDELKDMELAGDVESQLSQLSQLSHGGGGGGGGARSSRKHMSMDLAGSVFLIASDGRVLSLPVPSESPDDPLTWSRSRRVFILAILVLYSAACMFLIQTPGTLFKAFLADFTEVVRTYIHTYQPTRGWTMKTRMGNHAGEADRHV